MGYYPTVGGGPQGWFGLVMAGLCFSLFPVMLVATLPVPAPEVLLGLSILALAALLFAAVVVTYRAWKEERAPKSHSESEQEEWINSVAPSFIGNGSHR